jgi:hypothetical protein
MVVVYELLSLDGVATSTPLDRQWASTTAVDGELVEFVRNLRDQPGADIGVHASSSTTASSASASSANGWPWAGRDRLTELTH